MKKYKIDYVIPAISFVTAGLLLWLFLWLYDVITFANWWLRALYIGGVLPVTAIITFGAVYLSTLPRRKTKIRTPKLLSAATAVFLALLFLTGFFGQCIYSAKLLPPSSAANCEVVLLADESVASKSRSDEWKRAAERFIDGMDNSTALAVGVFTTEVVQSKELTQISDKTKNELKDVLSAPVPDGGTSITKALNWAYKTLEPGMGSDTKQAIVVVSDGNSPVYPPAVQACAEKGVRIYSLRLSGTEGRFTDAFLQTVADTGGFDTAVSDASSDSIDNLLKAFNGITSDVRANRFGHFEFSKNSVLLDNRNLFTDDLSFSAVLIRFAVYAITALLFQLICFRKVTLPSIAFVLGGSLIATVLVTIFGGAHLLVPAAPVLSLTLFTVIAVIQKEDAPYV